MGGSRGLVCVVQARLNNTDWYRGLLMTAWWMMAWAGEARCLAVLLLRASDSSPNCPVSTLALPSMTAPQCN